MSAVAPVLLAYVPARRDFVPPPWAKYLVTRASDGARLGYTSEAGRAARMATAIGVPCAVTEVRRG